MASDGREATDLFVGPERPIDPAPQRGCLLAGCDCKDRRIVSRRRARFHAHLARSRGETADRSIAPDPEWRWLIAQDGWEEVAQGCAEWIGSLGADPAGADS